MRSYLHIFDLDGVITDTAVVHQRAWINLANQICEEYDLTPRHEYNREYYLTRIDGKSRINGLKAILIDLEIGLEANRVERYMSLKEEMFFDELDKCDKSKLLFRDAIEYLDRLKMQPNTSIALATSSLNGRKIVSDIGIGEYFDFIVDGRVLLEYGFNGKPSPDIFNLVINKYKEKQTSFTIIYEDSEFGVSAALRSEANEVYCIERNKKLNERDNSKYLGDISKLKTISSLEELIK